MLAARREEQEWFGIVHELGDPGFHAIRIDEFGGLAVFGLFGIVGMCGVDSGAGLVVGIHG